MKRNMHVNEKAVAPYNEQGMVVAVNRTDKSNSLL